MRTLMPSATKAYVNLREAMRDAVPSCLGDTRFTSETADPVPLAMICAKCPLFSQCRTLAEASHTGPIFGVLGGLVRRGSIPVRERGSRRVVQI